jgi:hypothetical protein
VCEIVKKLEYFDVTLRSSYVRQRSNGVFLRETYKTRKSIMPANNKDAIIEALAILADRVRDGDVVGVTIVTTNKIGKAQIETVLIPSPGDVAAE